MAELKSLAGRAARALDLPPQLTTGVPVIELIGRNMLIINRHRGLTEYTAQRICAGSSLGLITVTGSALHITQMNHRMLVVSGTISGVSYQEADA